MRHCFISTFLFFTIALSVYPSTHTANYKPFTINTIDTATSHTAYFKPFIIKTIDTDIVDIPNIPNLPEDAKPLEMVLIPAGTFTMGSPADERGRDEYLEWAPHQVTLTKYFYIGRYEVTQAQYQAVMDDNPSGFQNKPDNPVEQVTWINAASFCNELSKQQGLTPVYNESDWTTDWTANGYRLPTEAEWEYACRAGTRTRFSFGNALEIPDFGDSYREIGDQYMWWKGNNTYSGNEAGAKEVGLKQPNPWNLYDMHGNVWEWCNDWWEEPSNRGSIVDPKGENSGSTRVYRGGSWGSESWYCRSAFRDALGPYYMNVSRGFRLCRTYDETKPVAPTNTPMPTPTKTPTPTLEIETITVDIPDLPEGAKPLEMVFITAGTFMMGSPSSDKDRGSDETQHQVTLTQDFYIGKYEVTQAQWEAVMGNNPSYFSEMPNNPVEQVSWNDCQEFITKLNQMGQGTFRLPTEAEWEYACRAGTTERFYWGDDPNDSQINDYAWYDGNSGYITKEVATKLPNRWGLFDMSGNVWEWCQDWYSDYPSTPVIDPVVTNSGIYRVLRGGCWSYDARYCRSASRYGSDPDFGYYGSGFRICRTDGILPTPTPVLPTDTPISTPTDTPTPTLTPTPAEPLPTPTPVLPTPTPTEISNEPGLEITTLELLRRCNGKSVVFTVNVEGVNGFNEKVDLYTPNAPNGFDVRFVPNPVVPPAVSRLILTPNSDNNIFDSITSRGLVEKFSIKGSSPSKSDSEEASIEILTRGYTTLDGDVVYREPIPIYLASPSKLDETAGSTVVVKGQIRSYTGISDVFVRALRPGDSNPVTEKVTVSDRGGYFEAEFLVENSDQLINDPDDVQWRIDASFDIGLNYLPLRGQSEPLFIPVGSIRANLPGKVKYRSVVQSQSLENYTGHVIIVGGKDGDDISAGQIEKLTGSIYKSLVSERRLTDDSVTLLSHSSNPQLDVESSEQGLIDAVDQASEAEFLLLYLIGSGERGVFYFASGTPLNGPTLAEILSPRCRDANKRTLVIIDIQQAGFLRDRLPTHKGLEIIASTGDQHPAIFSDSQGQPFSFSDLFFDAILSGKTVYKSLAYARNQLRRIQEPNIAQVPEPLESDLKEEFASLIIGSAFVEEDESINDNLPPAIEGVPASIEHVRGEPLVLEAAIRDEETHDKDSSGEDVVLSVRISQLETNVSKEISELEYITYDSSTDKFHLNIDNFPNSLFGDYAPNGQYSLSLLVQDNSDNSTAPAITSIDVVPSSADPVLKPDPIKTYEFDQNDIGANGWAEIPGGFSGNAPGTVSFLDFSFDPSLVPSSEDKKALAVTIQKKQITMFFALEPIATEGKPLLIRASMRANSPNAGVWLTALKGNLSSGVNVDNSQSLITSSNSSVISTMEQNLVVLYHPVGEELVTPVVQVAGLDAEGVTTVLIDRIEAYQIDQDSVYPSELFSTLPGDSGSTQVVNDLNPIVEYEFSKPNLQAMKWQEIPGGFTEESPGMVFASDFSHDANLLPSSNDRRGLAFSVQSGQVAFTYSKESLPYTGYPYLFKMQVQSDAPDASLWLVGLKGNLNLNEGVDGSLGFRQWANVANCTGKEQTMFLLYEPDSSSWMTPALQVASKSEASQNIIRIDSLQIYSLEPGQAYPGTIFMSKK